MKGGSNIAKNNTRYSIAKLFKDLTFGLKKPTNILFIGMIVEE